MAQEKTTLERLIAFNEKKHYSNRQLSRKIGISGATLSLYLAGKYSGDVKKIDVLVEHFFRTEAATEESSKAILPFIFTDNARLVFDTCRLSHLENEISVIAGPSGSGKTTAIKEYAKQSAQVILVEVDLSYSARVLLYELCKRLRLQLGSLHDMFEAIVEKLKDAHQLIIVDEAEHLPYRALEFLRALNDRTGNGIVLCGMPRLIANLKGKRGEYAQLFSRVGIVTELPPLSDSDLTKLVHHIMSDAKLTPIISEICKGNARTFQMLVKRVKKYTDKGRDLDAQLLKEVSKLLIK